MTISTLVLMASCDIFGNYGYPGKVSFGAEGGTKKVTGDTDFYSIELSTYNGNRVDVWRGEPEDTVVVSNDWLTVKGPWNGLELTITAKPNKTGKKRSIYIDLGVMDHGADIKVEQSAY